MRKNIKDCENITSILGDDVSDILKPLLFKFKDNGKVYCFNILELNEFTKNDTRNPYTRNPLPLQKIKNKIEYLKKILIPERLHIISIISCIHAL